MYCSIIIGITMSNNINEFDPYADEDQTIDTNMDEQRLSDVYADSEQFECKILQIQLSFQGHN